MLIADSINAIAPAHPATPQTLKIEIENTLAKRAATESLLYNPQASSVVDIFQKNRMPCYSGSMLFSAASLNLAHTEPALAKSLLIFRPGHVLPGYIAADEKGIPHP